jgi:Na+-transporting methylmalonyl-CoA/oxaloacetate decarboxylase gamma subunit
MTLLNTIADLAKDKPMFDPNSVTPGVIGFLVTFVFIVLIVLLVRDMVRRVRRTQYRAEVNERLDAEEAVQEKPDQA